MPRSRDGNSGKRDPLQPAVHRGVTALVRAVRKGKPLGPAARELAWDLALGVLSTAVASADEGRAKRRALVAELVERRRARRVRTSTHQDSADPELERIAQLKREIDQGKP